MNGCKQNKKENCELVKSLEREKWDLIRMREIK